MSQPHVRRLRSQEWFDDPSHADMTALYVERFMNYGLTREELAVGPADHRHRADGQRPRALQPASHRTRRAHEGRHSRRGRHSDGVSGASARRAEPPADRRARPQSRVSGPRRNPARLSARWRRAHHRLRQDHARLPDGGGHRRHAGDRPVRRADARRLAPRQAGRLRHGHLARAQSARDGRDRLRRLHGADDRLVAVDRALQHDGHRAFDEQPRRSARHVAAGLREHSGRVSRTRADGVRDRQAHRRSRARGRASVAHHDQGGVRERDRRGVRAGRVDQLPAAFDRYRAAYRRRTESRRLAARGRAGAADRELHAGGRISRRELSSRGRRARRVARACAGGPRASANA